MHPASTTANAPSTKSSLEINEESLVSKSEVECKTTTKSPPHGHSTAEDSRSTPNTVAHAVSGASDMEQDADSDRKDTEPAEEWMIEVSGSSVESRALSGGDAEFKSTIYPLNHTTSAPNHGLGVSRGRPFGSDMTINALSHSVPIALYSTFGIQTKGTSPRILVKQDRGASVSEYKSCRNEDRTMWVYWNGVPIDVVAALHKLKVDGYYTAVDSDVPPVEQSSVDTVGITAEITGLGVVEPVDGEFIFQ